MVRHVILWTLKDKYSGAEAEAIKAEMKSAIEGLRGQIPGLIDITLNINGLPGSNADIMLDSSFESEDALKGYAVHPAHVDVAENKVKPHVSSRVCLDFEA